MYKVQLERKTQKKLAKILPPYYTNIKIAFLDLADDPRPNWCIKLKGRDAYRIRVADYRVIYEIHDDVLLVQVIDLGHKKDIYWTRRKKYGVQNDRHFAHQKEVQRLLSEQCGGFVG